MVCSQVHISIATQGTQSQYFQYKEAELQEFVANYSNVKDRYGADWMSHFEKFPLFQRFLKAKYKVDSKEFPKENQRSVVFDYVKNLFERYLNTAIAEKMRVLSLTKQLEVWGARNGETGVPGLDGYELLNQISRKNFDKVVRQSQLVQLEKLPADVQALVAKVDLEFRHNSGFSRISGPAMLSSQRLQEAGFGKTTQASREFNQQELQSSDQLYFFVQPIVKKAEGQTFQNVSSQYGSQSLYLKSAFAKKRGWISAYVMDPSDLTLFLQNLVKVDPFRKLKTRKDEIESLHLSVFNVEDFTALYQTILANYIYFKQDFPFVTNHEKLRSILLGESSYPRAISDLKEIMAIYGLSGGLMELKVPVSVPASEIVYPN